MAGWAVRGRSTLGWLQAVCCCRAQENTAVARAVKEIQADPSPQAQAVYQRHSLCRGGTGKGTSKPQTGGDKREERTGN